MENYNSLSALIKAIPDESAARAFMEKIIWNGTPICPHCYNQGGYKLKDGKTYKCKDKRCRKTFTVTVERFLKKPKCPLTKWVYAIYLCTIHKRGVSSYQLATDIHVTQKTAWFMLHRIRKLFKDKAHDILVEEVEIDESFVGGKNKNRHRCKKIKNSEGRSLC
ncbi:MAG: IS1595 family transposase [Chitinophagaceae bacterium]